MPAWNLKIRQAHGKQGIAALINEKQKFFDKIHADN